MRVLLFGAFGSVLIALIFTGWGLVSKKKEDRESAKWGFLLVWVVSMALWIYGTNNSGIGWS